MNVEGKIFFWILVKRVTQFLLSNKYIDTSVQNGGVPGIPECIEHSNVISKIFGYAKKNQGILEALWLDLMNACSIILHKLVDKTLHVPQMVQLLLRHFFGHLTQNVCYCTIEHLTTNWQRPEFGIVTGCTISMILFTAAKNLLVKPR